MLQHNSGINYSLLNFSQFSTNRHHYRLKRVFWVFFKKDEKFILKLWCVTSTACNNITLASGMGMNCRHTTDCSGVECCLEITYLMGVRKTYVKADVQCTAATLTYQVERKSVTKALSAIPNGEYLRQGRRPVYCGHADIPSGTEVRHKGPVCHTQWWVPTSRQMSSVLRPRWHTQWWVPTSRLTSSVLRPRWHTKWNGSPSQRLCLPYPMVSTYVKADVQCTAATLSYPMVSTYVKADVQCTAATLTYPMVSTYVKADVQCTAATLTYPMVSTYVKADVQCTAATLTYPMVSTYVKADVQCTAATLPYPMVSTYVKADIKCTAATLTYQVERKSVTKALSAIPNGEPWDLYQEWNGYFHNFMVD